MKISPSSSGRALPRSTRSERHRYQRMVVYSLLLMIATLACLRYLLRPVITVIPALLNMDTSAVSSSSSSWWTTSLRGSSRVEDENESVPVDESILQCRFFLAESAIPQGGLGMYTAVEISPGQISQAMPDICVYVADAPRGKTDFFTHSWARDVFLGNFEGESPRGACEGLATLFNSMPPDVATSELVSIRSHDHGGLTRQNQPGAGAITHYYGISSKARRRIRAGEELTIDYGDFTYEDDKEYVNPIRSTSWLHKHGLCADHIRIRTATNPAMGRGAFAARALKQGAVVAPVPLQTYPRRKIFRRKNQPEALFVNYCLQPPGSDMLLFPYGQGVNLINHDREHPNVALRWSTHRVNHLEWLDLPLDQFWSMVYPGALVMEVVALRDLQEGEELFMDYGADWDQAWREHVQQWKPDRAARNYVYAQDMNLTQPFKTWAELKKQPYADNLMTVCQTDNWDRTSKRMRWQSTSPWSESLVMCHVLQRTRDVKTGSYVYEVAYNWDNRADFNPGRNFAQIDVDYGVPHSAIIFLDKPYRSDMHLRNAFRHPIGLPLELTPPSWITH